MADIDIDPFGEHESRTEEPTDENIPLTPVTPGRSTWEPEREHETSFGSPEVPLSRGERNSSQRIPSWRNIRTNR